jgi:hypothetical protein
MPNAETRYLLDWEPAHPGFSPTSTTATTSPRLASNANPGPPVRGTG